MGLGGNAGGRNGMGADLGFLQNEANEFGEFRLYQHLKT